MSNFESRNPRPHSAQQRQPDEVIFGWSSRFVIWLIVAGFILTGIGLMSVFGPTAWLLLIGVMAGCMLIGRPRILLWVYWGLAVIYPYLSTVYGSVVLKWSDEMFAVAMLGVLAMHYIHDRSLFRKLRPFNRTLAALLVLTFVSGLANDVPKKLVLHFILQYLRMFLLFYFAYVFVRDRDLRQVIWAIGLMVVLQFVMNFTWLAGINPLPHWMSGPDFCIGTGIGANVCAYYSIMLICILTAWMIISQRTAHRVWCLILIVISLVHFFFTFTYHAYMALPVCLGLLLLVTRVQKTRLYIWGSVAVLLVSSIVLLLPADFRRGMHFEFDPARLGDRLKSLRYGPKGQSYIQNVTVIPKALPYPIIGAGPGNAGSMVARINRRPLADQYFTWVDLSVESRSLSFGASIVGGPMTGIITLWSELGPMGLILYWGLHVYAFFWVWTGLRRGLYTNRYKLILAQAFIPIMAFYIGLSLLADYSWVVYMNAIWIWAGCVWRRDVAPAAANVRQPMPLTEAHRRRIHAST